MSIQLLIITANKKVGVWRGKSRCLTSETLIWRASDMADNVYNVYNDNNEAVVRFLQKTGGRSRGRSRGKKLRFVATCSFLLTLVFEFDQYEARIADLQAHIRRLEAELAEKNRQLESFAVIALNSQRMIAEAVEKGRTWWKFWQKWRVPNAAIGGWMLWVGSFNANSACKFFVRKHISIYISASYILTIFFKLAAEVNFYLHG